MNKLFMPCKRCENGYIFNIDGVKKCDCLIQYHSDQLFYIKFRESGIPDKILNYQIEDYIGNSETPNKIKNYIDNFESTFNKCHCYFWSKENSTQKTTLVWYIGRELIKKHYFVRFVYMNNLINNLKDSQFEDSCELKDYVNDLLHCDFLIIDDCFDRNKVQLYQSGYQISFLDNFLRQRLEQLNKPVIFTANVSIDEIGNIWGISIQELVRRNINIELLFTDRVDKKVNVTNYTSNMMIEG